jgi:hypothetical protein
MKKHISIVDELNATELKEISFLFDFVLFFKINYSNAHINMLICAETFKILIILI